MATAEPKYQLQEFSSEKNSPQKQLTDPDPTAEYQHQGDLFFLKSHNYPQEWTYRRKFKYYLEYDSGLNKELLKKLLHIFSLERVKVFKDRICEGKPKRYYKKKCDTDNEEMLVVNSDGTKEKQEPRLTVCGSPFCRNEDCFKQKYDMATLLFSIYFYSRPHYLTKRGDQWAHFSIGDKRQTLYTKEDLKDFHKRCYAFLNAVKKTHFPNLKGILESDLAFDETRIGEECFNHNHGAFRPFGLSRDKKKFAQQLKEINEIAAEHKVMFNWIGYRKSKWLIDYFAKRHAGKFGHKAYDGNPSTEFRFADIMTAEHYYKNHLGMKKIKLYGFSRKEMSWIKRNAKKILDNAVNNSGAVNDNRLPAVVLVYKSLYLFENLFCPKCGGNKSHRQEVFLEEDKPPDKKQEEIAYEVVSFRGNSPTTYKIHDKTSPEDIQKETSYKECLNCDLSVAITDWNFKQGMCNYCCSLAHAISYPPSKEYERTKFIMKNLWELRLIKREPDDEKFDKLSNKKTFKLNCGEVL